MPSKETQSSEDYEGLVVFFPMLLWSDDDQYQRNQTYNEVLADDA